jgi:hypothetical protein
LICAVECPALSSSASRIRVFTPLKVASKNGAYLHDVVTSPPPVYAGITRPRGERAAIATRTLRSTAPNGFSNGQCCVAAAKSFNNNAFVDQVDARFDRASLNCPATDGAARDDHFRPVDLSELANRALSGQEWSGYVGPTHLVTKDNIGINAVTAGALCRAGWTPPAKCIRPEA